MAILIFVVAWWIGAAALIGGLEVAQGPFQTLVAACAFAGACTFWWGAYKLSGYGSTGGFIVIALWMLGLLGTLLDFRYYATRPFFWAAAAMVICLVAAAGLSKVHR
jgi:hypothetical protein